MIDGPPKALSLIDEIAITGDLENYHLLHAARADLLRRVGMPKEAAQSYEHALALVAILLFSASCRDEITTAANESKREAPVQSGRIGSAVFCRRDVEAINLSSPFSFT